MKKFIIWAVLPVLMFAFTACSTSQLTSSWNAQNISNDHFNKILVLGLLSDKNRGVKDKMESEMVLDLGKFHQNAVAASKVYPPKAFVGLNETEALEKLSNDGYDAVMTISLINKESQKQYVPGGWGPGFYPYYGSFWGYYSFYSPWMMGGPGMGYGYVANVKTYSFETNLYDVTSNNTLIYSAQSDSFDPSNASGLATDYARTIVKDLIKIGVVKR